MFIGKQAKYLLFVVCVLLGLMLSVQYKSFEHAKISLSQQRAEDMTEKLKNAEKENKQLQAEIEKLHAESSTDSSARALADYKTKAGETILEGPGIKVTVDDSKVVAKPGENQNLYVIHDDDLLRLINELKAAGAEALSLNKERLIDTSEIRCAGPTVSVNNTRFTPPYEIQAIGDPKTLEGALRLRGGIIETFKFWGIDIKVEQQNDIVIPAFKGTKHFEFAKVKEGAAQ